MKRTDDRTFQDAAAQELTTKQKAALCRAGWLSTCPNDFQTALLNLGTVKLLQPGDILFRRGKVPTHVHGLISGQIDMVFLSQSKEELVYPATGSNNWYSFSETITQEKADSQANAQRPTLVLSIPRKDFMAFLDEDPQRYQSVIAHDNAQRRYLQDIIVDLATFDGVALVTRRLAWMLESGRIDPRQSFIVSQHDFARSMGLSIPTVQRAFRQLKAEGILTTDYGKFYLNDREKLEAFSKRA